MRKHSFQKHFFSNFGFIFINLEKNLILLPQSNFSKINGLSGGVVVSSPLLKQKAPVRAPPGTKVFSTWKRRRENKQRKKMELDP